MPNLVLANTSSMMNTAASGSMTLSGAQELLTSMGLADQRADIVRENHAHHDRNIKLHDAITKYENHSDSGTRMNLIKELDTEIKFLQKEYQHSKAKQAEYKKPTRKNTGWRSWLDSIKEFFGSDNEYQTERYGKIAAERKEQIEELQAYQNEIEQDIIELDTEDASPMRRRLLMLPVADEFRVNTNATNIQDNPAIAVQSNGDFIITWHSVEQDGSGYGIYAQRFSSDGTLIGPEFRVNTYTLNNQQSPTIAVQSNNDFIISWYGAGQDGNGIYAQRFNSDGTPIGSEFHVNINTFGIQTNAAVAAQPDGSFIFAWEAGEAGSGGNTYYRRFNSSGAPISADLRANTYTPTVHQPLYDAPVIGVQPNGNFIIAWTSYLQDGDLSGIYARRFSSNGTFIGAEFPVNTYTVNHQWRPSIGVQPNGDFIIAWQSFGQDGSGYGAYAQRFMSNGTRIDSEFRVNNATQSSQGAPVIGVEPNGDFIIAFHNSGQPGGSGVDISVRHFSSNGTPIGFEFRANNYTQNSQVGAVVGTQPNRNAVIAWQSIAQDGDGGGIYVRIFSPLSMGNNTLTVNQGQTTTLTTTVLSATSGGEPSDIYFTVSSVLNGQFEFSSNPGVAITQFNKQQIIDGIVKFIHNGSANAPSFSTTVTDGNETQGPFAATIHFTPTPAVSSSTGVSSSSSTADASSSSTGKDESSSSTADAESAHSSSSTGGGDEVSSSSSSGVESGASSSSSTGGAAGGASSSTAGVTDGSTGGGSSTADSSSSAHGIAASSSTGVAAGSSGAAASSSGVATSSGVSGSNSNSSSSSSGGAETGVDSSSSGVGGSFSSSGDNGGKTDATTQTIIIATAAVVGVGIIAATTYGIFRHCTAQGRLKYETEKERRIRQGIEINAQALADEKKGREVSQAPAASSLIQLSQFANSDTAKQEAAADQNSIIINFGGK